MKVKSFAKVNLALDVLKKDATGYHQIKTIFYEYKDLFDEIEIEKNLSGEIVFNCNKIFGTNNSCIKAAQILQKKYKIKNGANIYLTKNIPIGSGLGGASSNAAAVLKDLNKLWDLKLSVQELEEVAVENAVEIGMDTPFFIRGGIALGQHYGEKLTPINSDLKLDIKVLWPNIFASTKVSFESLDLSKCGLNSNSTQLLIDALEANNLASVLANLHNDFATLNNMPFSDEIKKSASKLQQMGAKKTLLCGSGSSVFGIF